MEQLPPYNAVMLDLETMSTSNNAAITSIGAVKFWLNVKQAEFTEDQLFYYAVDLKSCQKAGLDIDADTIQWWMQQADEPRSMLFDRRRESLAAVLNMFSHWFPKNAYIFGNGATFDNVILRTAFKALNIKYPAIYKQDVCYRTLCKLSDIPPPKFEGTKHNALDDAKMQTRHLMEILEKYPWMSK